VINYLLNKGIVHTRLGANFLLLIAFFAMSGLTSFLWNEQHREIDYVIDQYGEKHSPEDWIDQELKRNNLD
jgi:hypothetical protein